MVANRSPILILKLAKEFHPSSLILHPFVSLEVLCPVILAVLLATNSSLAQHHRGSPGELAADVVTLSGGKTIYGIVVKSDENDGVRMYVERQWLKSNEKALFDQFAKTELERFATVRQQTLERLATWIDERRPDTNLVEFLESERERLQNQKPDRRGGAKNKIESKKFILATFASDNVEKVVSQTPQQRHVAGVAWNQGLKDVSIRTAKSLVRELRKLNIDVANETFDFSDEIPADLQSTEQWNARKAIIEYEFREPLEFYASGQALIRRGEKPNLGLLIGQVMGSQLDINRIGRELGLPEFNTPPEKPKHPEEKWRAATSQAEGDGIRGVLITELQQDLSSPEITVRSAFLAQVRPGIWKPLIRVAGNANINNQPAEKVDALRADPQIKQALDLLGGLGFGNANQTLELALKHGAATEAALADVNEQFFRFQSQYTGRVDGPPILLGK